MYDDDVSYRLRENYIVEDNFDRGEKLKVRRFLRKNFPFTNFYMFVIKNLDQVGYEPENQNKNQPSFHKFNINAYLDSAIHRSDPRVRQIQFD